MKRKIVFLVSLFLSIGLYAQNSADTIQIKKNVGTVYIHHGQKLKPRDLVDIMASNPEAHTHMRKAKSNYDIGTVFGSIGGFMIGWPLGTAIGGGDPEWVLAGIGGALAIVSIPFYSSYNKHARTAVSAYNIGILQPDMGDVELRIGATRNGFGLTANF